MSATMKGLCKLAKGPGLTEVVDIDVPELPADDWVLIKIKAAGLCATDLHVYHDEFRYWPPVVLGHEFSGQVVQVGSSVTNFAVGDRVVAEPKNEACGKCDVCREGKINLCLHRRAPGWGVHGGMTSYIAMPEFLVHRIPEGVSYDIAALCEPMACIVYAVTERAKLECSDVVYISGAGPMGVLSAFVAKSCGASKVVMSGMTKSEAVRFPAALKVGADYVLNVEKEDPVKFVMELTGGRGADLVVETSGAAPAIAAMTDLIKPCGRISGIGIAARDLTPIKWNEAMYKQLDIYFNFSSSYASWDKSLKLMHTTKYDLNHVITHRTTIDNWKQVFEDIEQERGVKAMFVPADEL